MSVWPWCCNGWPFLHQVSPSQAAVAPAVLLWHFQFNFQILISEFKLHTDWNYSAHKSPVISFLSDKVHNIQCWPEVPYILLYKGCQKCPNWTGNSGLYLWKEQEFKIVEELWPTLFLLLQLFLIPAPFRDIGCCCLSSWDIFQLTPFKFPW